MTTLRVLAAATALTLAAGLTAAQPGPGYGPGASGPMSGSAVGGRMGASGPMMGGRMGASAPMMSGGRWGANATPGWALMTPQERQSHQAKMQAMTSHDECAAYAKEHHAQMVERAKEKGRALPAQPQRDACAGMKR